MENVSICGRCQQGMVDAGYTLTEISRTVSFDSKAAGIKARKCALCGKVQALEVYRVTKAADVEKGV